MVMKDTIVFVTGINFLLQTDYNMHIHIGLLKARKRVFDVHL